MGAFFIIAVAVAALAAFAVLAVQFGVDSRSESRDPRSPDFRAGLV